jgi:hypothetical protein
MCARLRAGPPDFEATVANAMRTSVVTRNCLSKNNSDAAPSVRAGTNSANKLCKEVIGNHRKYIASAKLLAD